MWGKPRKVIEYGSHFHVLIHVSTVNWVTQFGKRVPDGKGKTF